MHQHPMHGALVCSCISYWVLPFASHVKEHRFNLACT